MLLTFLWILFFILLLIYIYKQSSVQTSVQTSLVSFQEGMSSKCSKSDVQEMAGLVYQLNGRVKNLEKDMNKVKLDTAKALEIANQNKKDVNNAKESIKEEEGKMKNAESELDKVAAGL